MQRHAVEDHGSTPIRSEAPRPEVRGLEPASMIAHPRIRVPSRKPSQPAPGGVPAAAAHRSGGRPVGRPGRDEAVVSDGRRTGSTGT